MKEIRVVNTEEFWDRLIVPATRETSVVQVNLRNYMKTTPLSCEKVPDIVGETSFFRRYFPLQLELEHIFDHTVYYEYLGSITTIFDLSTEEHWLFDMDIVKLTHQIGLRLRKYKSWFEDVYYCSGNLKPFAEGYMTYREIDNMTKECLGDKLDNIFYEGTTNF